MSQGFRPFFLAAGLWAAVALSLWIVMLDTGEALPSRFPPLAWHIHEMLFGFVMAAVAGFLLTAIPNWTRRLPVAGTPLAALAGLWLLGRITCLISQWLPAWLAIAADLAFPIMLAAVVMREIIAAKNQRNMVMIAPVILLGIANLLMHLAANDVGIPQGLGWRLALAAILVLVSVIGGRIIPGFTRNWLTQRHIDALPASHGLADRLSLFSLHGALLTWAVFPSLALAGALLLTAALCNMWRLWRWQGVKTVSEPLLVILHIAYGWLCIGAGLLGLSVLMPVVPQSAGIHAMTIGAIGTMILAVMTRATRGHTGHILSADRTTTYLYGCVIAAAIMRIIAAFWTSLMMPFLIIAAVLWSAAFLLFIVRYGPMLCLPRPDHGQAKT
jgi:uncharacterized protein involved in response to NO